MMRKGILVLSGFVLFLACTPTQKPGSKEVCDLELSSLSEQAEKYGDSVTTHTKNLLSITSHSNGGFVLFSKFYKVNLLNSEVVSHKRLLTAFRGYFPPIILWKDMSAMISTVQDMHRSFESRESEPHIDTLIRYLANRIIGFNTDLNQDIIYHGGVFQEKLFVSFVYHLEQRRPIAQTFMFRKGMNHSLDLDSCCAVPMDTFEEAVGYDFLTWLPASVQDTVENRDFSKNRIIKYNSTPQWGIR